MESRLSKAGIIQPVTVHIIVDNRVRMLDFEFPSQDVLEDIKQLFTHPNPKRDAMRRMGVRAWFREPTHEETCVFEHKRSGRYLTVPRGGLRRVVEYLKSKGIDHLIEDHRCKGSADLAGQMPRHKMQLRGYQEAATNAAIMAQTCMVRAPTGSGKTEFSFAIASRVNLPTLVLVNTRELLDQWVKRADKALGIRERDVGVIQGKRRILKPLTVAMQQSLYRQKFDRDFAETWGTLIYDEVQLASASSFYAVVDQFPARYRIGVSDDNRRKDKREYLNHDLFGEVAYEISRDQLEDEGHIVDVKILVVPTDFKADWYGNPDDDDEKELDFSRLSDEMTNDDARTLLAVEAAASEANAGERVFVMARRREHCQRIAAALVARGVTAGYLIGGEDYRNEFKQTCRDMHEGRIRVGVGTIQSIGTGIDFPAVGAIVVATPVAGNRQAFRQIRGRACRVSDQKEFGARLYYLWDKQCSYGFSHLKNIVAQNRKVTVLAPGGAMEGREYLRQIKAARRSW